MADKETNSVQNVGSFGYNSTSGLWEEINVTGGALNVTGGGGGTEYVEDVAAADPATGTATLMKRDDQLSTITPVAGDWTGMLASSKGALWVTIPDASGDPITSFGGGTQYATNDVAADPSTGTAMLMERDDALGGVTPAEGDWMRMFGDANGALWVHVAAGTEAFGKLAANSGVDIGDVDVLTVGGQTPTYGAGAVAAGTQRTTLASDDPAVALLGTIDTDTSALAGTVSGSELQVDIIASLPAGTNGIGKLTANSGVDIGDVDVLSIAAGGIGARFTGMGDGVKTVTSAGTDEALAGSTACKRVTIQAQTDNTGLIAIGATGVDATVATGTGVILNPGDSYELDIDDLATIFIDSTVSGEGVRYTYFT